MRFARDAYPLAGACLLLAAGAAVWSPWAACLPLAAAAFSLFFFRDPQRNSPQDPDALLAPADGRIIVVRPGRISIFLSVFNVHVCRTPVAGKVLAIRHQRGEFFAAFRDEASEQNERAAIDIGAARGGLTFTLIAGWVARRIVCWVAEGESLAAGQRVGLIRFGSRVDVDLPHGARPAVALGDRVRAGETVLARWE